MIDTDKYEGHTEGPWKPLRLNEGYWTVGNFGYQWKEADKQLIADAPLLLAEVKRLREEKKRLRDMVEKARPFLNMTMREHVGYYDEEYRGEEE